LAGGALRGLDFHSLSVGGDSDPEDGRPGVADEIGWQLYLGGPTYPPGQFIVAFVRRVVLLAGIPAWIHFDLQGGEVPRKVEARIRIEEADPTLAAMLDVEKLGAVIEQIPEELLTGTEYAGDARPRELRTRYRDYLLTRLRAPRPFLAEAVEARERLRRLPPLPLSARR
jgi:hypothetical protein